LITFQVDPVLQNVPRGEIADQLVLQLRPAIPQRRPAGNAGALAVAEAAQPATA
jgi:hypothetical protein